MVQLIQFLIYVSQFRLDLLIYGDFDKNLNYMLWTLCKTNISKNMYKLKLVSDSIYVQIGFDLWYPGF